MANAITYKDIFLSLPGVLHLKKLVIQENVGNHIVIFCNGEIGSVKTMSCAGECIPDIVSSGWDEVKDNVFTDGQKPVRGIAILKCRWGGVITIELTGQPEG